LCQRFSFGITRFLVTLAAGRNGSTKPPQLIRKSECRTLGCGPAEYADIPPETLHVVKVFGCFAIWVWPLLLLLGRVRAFGSNGTHDHVTLFVVPDELHPYALSVRKYLARLELLLIRWRL
jgi:hypothetical protein